ncbi:MAG: alternate-type signal peptide domain-containing protein [Bifidobacteriaceae bacterium]|jgi:alternate signal-mediated exported protein|nr:alternate-type signal peptide domain-containing protein [Bifidobacteriaceae bacterium]
MTKFAGAKRGGALFRSALAAGAATAVLLGGFGVFALWKDSAHLGTDNKATINSGEISLEAQPGTGVWKLENPGGTNSAVDVADIDNYVISPGDRLSYTGMSFKGHVTGSDIKAKLQLTNTGNGQTILADAVKDYVTVKYKIGNLPPGDVILEGTQAQPTAYLGGADSAQTVEVYIQFAEDTPADAAQNVMPAIDFSAGLDLVLQQL